MSIQNGLVTSSPSPSSPSPLRNQILACSSNPSPLKKLLVSSLAPLALTVALSTSPLPTQAIPFIGSPPNALSRSTPFSQSRNLKLGLDNGKIRPCPSVNPGCVSTNPKSSSFASPWVIPEKSSQNAFQELKDAIVKTQNNATIKVDEEVQNGHYLQVEVDAGGLSRDVMEFLVKKDVVLYRVIATKVRYIYPFTTAFGDAKGQNERIKKIVEELGWFAPNIELMDS